MNRLQIALFTLVRRSTHWRIVRKSFLQLNPTCAGCGTTENLEVHHVIPFHVDPAKELYFSNLIPLCQSWLGLKHHCHRTFGHPDGWATWNPHVRANAHYNLIKLQRGER